MESQDIRPIVIFGKECEQYAVTEDGRVYNKAGQFMKPSPKDKTRKHLRVSLSIPTDTFDYDYRQRHENSNKMSIDRYVHQLVMETFRPIYQYPPDALKDVWNDIPEVAKQWIAETITIDHKDNDPENNHVDNLEYVTQKQNSHRAVLSYGGNTANKNKKVIPVVIEDDEEPVITVFDFL
jgi:hypothetical protein